MYLHLSVFVSFFMIVSCGEHDPAFNELRSGQEPEDADALARSVLPDGGSVDDSGVDGGSGADGGSDADGGGDADGGSDGHDGGADDGSDGSDGKDPEELLESCLTETHQVVAQVLDFPARKDCSWGMNGNLTIKDTYIRARETQTVSVPIPPGATICKIDLEAQTNQIHFDDFFAFHVNDLVLAASRVITNALETDADGHYQWDWLRVRDESMANLGKYCVTGDCELPEHDDGGPFALNLSLQEAGDDDPEMAIHHAALFSKLSVGNSLDFTAVATGDNDDNDCEHSGGVFDLSISYLPAGN